MYGTDLFLDITVHDGWRSSVAQPASAPNERCATQAPRGSSTVYRWMIDHHRQARDLVLTWRL